MTRKQKKTLIRIIAAGALFAAALLVRHFVPGLPWWAELVMFIVPYLAAGYDVLIKAARNIVRGQVFDENFLMGLATIGAFAVREYPEAAAVMLFYQIGELFQSVAVGRSRRSIAALMDIRPDHAVVIRDGEEIEVSPEEVAPGEEIIVRVGERIPLDGMIVSGSTSLNTVALTGESAPRDCGEGENVLSGAVNIGGVIRVKTTGTYSESTVARILELVESSSEKKAKTENFITRFARFYTPAVVAAALILALVPPLVFKADWSTWIHRALIFLVVSCPCALVISVPLSFFCGMGGASKSGILVKGSNYMEALSKVGTVVFDKTGTLTKGSFDVAAIHPHTVSEAALLDIAAMAESYSNHPIASSIVRAHGGHIDKSRISGVEELSGLGIRAVIDGKTVYAGSRKLMEKLGVETSCGGNCHCEERGTCVHVSQDGEYCGHLMISDEVKEGSERTISELKARGIGTVMLTGDSEAVGSEVGARLGLDEVRCELLPQDKVSIVEGMLSPKGRTLAFVGDGINDAPVLAIADVGLAMGALGSDAAIEAADVVLTDDKPEKVPEAIRISKKTMRIVRQNIVFALAVKLAVLILGAFGIANMWIAVFADVGVAVIAILNAIRAMKK
ncbi:MAG: heavy metal translocating P-type ATPase [Clostridiales bacterium]|nr:heavy metal translocating P-type ATPase [Clostridiales bacterium]